MTANIDFSSVPRDPRCEFSNAWWSVLHATRGAPEGFQPSRRLRSQRRDAAETAVPSAARADYESLVHEDLRWRNNESIARR